MSKCSIDFGQRARTTALKAEVQRMKDAVQARGLSFNGRKCALGRARTLRRNLYLAVMLGGCTGCIGLRSCELLMLNTMEHLLTNPVPRMASQNGSIDWFRFWMQGYEDPHPGTVDQ